MAPGIAISGRLASRFSSSIVALNFPAVSRRCVRSPTGLLYMIYEMDMVRLAAATIRLDAVVFHMGASLSKSVARVARSIATVVRLVAALIKFNEQSSVLILWYSLLPSVLL